MRRRATTLAIAALALLIAGCTRRLATGPGTSAARAALDAYLAIPIQERRPEDFAKATETLRALGASGVRARIELLGTLSPSMAEEGCGLEWEEGAARAAMEEIDGMGEAALPGVLEGTRSPSGTVRAFAYASLLGIEFDGRDPRIREAVMKGLSDPYRGARNIALRVLFKLTLSPSEQLELLVRTCTASPEEETLVAALDAMGELGLGDGTPFARSVAFANSHRGNDRVLAAAITTLALFEDWTLEDMLVERASASTIDPHDFDFYCASGPVARWALARKAGYDYPRFGTGCDLAHVWWELEGRRLYVPGSPAARAEFGEAVKGLAAGVRVESGTLSLHSWLNLDVAVRNCTDEPMRVMISAPVGRGMGGFFAPLVEFLPPRGPVAWRDGGCGGALSVLMLPPGGIAGIPASVDLSSFSPAPAPSDVVRLSVEYRYDGSPGDPEGIWKGVARSGSVTLTVGPPASGR